MTFSVITTPTFFSPDTFFNRPFPSGVSHPTSIHPYYRISISMTKPARAVCEFPPFHKTFCMKKSSDNRAKYLRGVDLSIFESQKRSSLSLHLHISIEQCGTKRYERMI